MDSIACFFSLAPQEQEQEHEAAEPDRSREHVHDVGRVDEPPRRRDRRMSGKREPDRRGASTDDGSDTRRRGARLPERCRRRDRETEQHDDGLRADAVGEHVGEHSFVGDGSEPEPGRERRRDRQLHEDADRTDDRGPQHDLRQPTTVGPIVEHDRQEDGAARGDERPGVADATRDVARLFPLLVAAGVEQRRHHAGTGRGPRCPR